MKPKTPKYTLNPALPWQDIARDGVFDDWPKEDVFKVLGSRDTLTLLEFLATPLKGPEKLWIAYNRFGFCSSRNKTQEQFQQEVIIMNFCEEIGTSHTADALIDAIKLRMEAEEIP